jgi:hypothetical protein
MFLALFEHSLLMMLLKGGVKNGGEKVIPVPQQKNTGWCMRWFGPIF